MTRLRKRMLEELQRRDYSHSTVRIYLHIVSDFARYFRRSPDTLGPEQIRQYQLHLFQKKLSPYTIRQHTAALRFFFFKVRSPVICTAVIGMICIRPPAPTPLLAAGLNPLSWRMKA